jgi:hypothetical protein
LNNAVSDRFNFIRSSRCEGDLRAGTRKIHCNAFANTATCASDHGNVVFERKSL